MVESAAGTPIPIPKSLDSCRCSVERDSTPLLYGIAIGVGSGFRILPFVTPGPVYVGDPILLTALISEAGLPIRGCTVTVEATRARGNDFLAVALTYRRRGLLKTCARLVPRELLELEIPKELYKGQRRRRLHNPVRDIGS